MTVYTPDVNFHFAFKLTLAENNYVCIYRIFDCKGYWPGTSDCLLSHCKQKMEEPHNQYYDQDNKLR